MAVLNQNTAQFNKYLETQIQTASPIQLICMLYDGAIKFSNLAIAGIKEKNIEKKTVNIIKTENIINELRVSLNFEKGGEIAKNLDKLYDYIYVCLMDANSNDDLVKLENVLKILSSLRESWYAIAKNPSGVPVGAQQPNQQPAPAQNHALKQPAGTYSKPVNSSNSKDKLDLAC